MKDFTRCYYQLFPCLIISAKYLPILSLYFQYFTITISSTSLNITQLSIYIHYLSKLYSKKTFFSIHFRKAVSCTYLHSIHKVYQLFYLTGYSPGPITSALTANNRNTTPPISVTEIEKNKSKLFLVLRTGFGDDDFSFFEFQF